MTNQVIKFFSLIELSRCVGLSMCLLACLH